MIYLDHAAATPVCQKAVDAMMPYFTEQFFNPSAPYLSAKRVRQDYEDAKNRLAHTIGAKGNDLVITAGATESINLAFTAVEMAVDKYRATGQTQQDFGAPQILISAIEHASVRAAANSIANKIGAKVQVVKVNHFGIIDLEDFRNKLNRSTVFVSIALANNEIGSTQPLAEISEIIRAERAQRLENRCQLPIFLHSDASQALSLLNVNVARLGVDLLTINAAKVYGPKGVGALYVSHGVRLQPVVHGGGQENGLRSGTENVAGVMGFAVAAELAKQHLSNYRRACELASDILRSKLAKISYSLPDHQQQSPIFLGSNKHRLSSFCSISLPGIDAERLIYKLEDSEIYLSTGAACAASKGEKSHVLQAIGLSDEEIAGSLRISLGMTNLTTNEHGQLIPDESQLNIAVEKIVAAVYEEVERLGGTHAN